MKLIKVSSRARRDISEISDYLAQDNYEIADKFVVMAKRTFGFLLSVPGVGQKYMTGSMQNNIRYFPVMSFSKHLVFYIARNSGIRIVRVLHEARNIDLLL